MNGLQINHVSGKDFLEAIKGSTDKDYSDLVNLSYHSAYPYVSVCYSHDCNLSHFTDPNWDEITHMARGIIVNASTGEIVSKAFNKFFNYDPQFHKLDITKDSYILEKLDGSMGITYRSVDGNDIFMATKNSFISEMAVFGNDWLKRIGAKDFFDPKITYLFEIIYPENRIVIDYGDRKECVLIGMVETATGNELSYKEVLSFAKKHNISIPKKFEFKNFSEIMKMCDKLPWNEEGFVVNVPTKEGLCKFKLKGEEYKIVHHTAFNTGTRAIWKMVRDGIDIETAIEFLPDDLKKEKIQVYDEILSDRKAIVDEAYDYFKQIYCPNINRAKFAELAKYDEFKKYRRLLFLMLDDKWTQVDNVALRMIEDKYKQKGDVDGDE